MMSTMSAEQWLSLDEPTKNLDALLSQIGCKLYPFDRPVIQYVKWSVELGLFEALIEGGDVRLSALSKLTPLNERGLEALLGVLNALGLTRLDQNSTYALTNLARDYLVKSSPYFIGNVLHGPQKKIPGIFLKKSNRFFDNLKLRLVWIFYGTNFGDKNRLRNQQTRNIAASVVAVNSGEFANSRSLLDLAGGSGVFSIPLALKYRDVNVVLAELPKAVKNVKPYVDAVEITSRYTLCPMNVFERPWRLGVFDTIYIGNFLHGFSDEDCISICRECFKHLESGGKIWIHEMLWNDAKSGPMITALWNVSMCLAGGRQRTHKEVEKILAAAGFVDFKRIPTATAMEMTGAVKP